MKKGAIHRLTEVIVVTILMIFLFIFSIAISFLSPGTELGMLNLDIYGVNVSASCSPTLINILRTSYNGKAIAEYLSKSECKEIENKIKTILDEVSATYTGYKLEVVVEGKCVCNISENFSEDNTVSCVQYIPDPETSGTKKIILTFTLK